MNIIANADLPSYCANTAGGTDGSTTDVTANEIPTVASSSDTPYVSGLEIHFFSTGHDDDAILIRNQDKVIIIDGGRCDPSNTSGKTDPDCKAGKKFVNYLKTVGVTKIDALIGSHGDWDHIQAHSVIVKNFKVAEAYYPIQLKDCVKDSVHGCNEIDTRYMYDALMDKKITPTFINVEEKPIIQTLGDLRLFYIGPPWPRRGNKGSFVFILQYGEKRFMFTGDQTWKNLASDDSLKILKDRASQLGTNIKVDLFKWPHHGINSDELTDKIEKNFFKEIGASYIVVPNSGRCGGTQVNYAVDNLGLKKYSNCGNTNLVITSDGEKIKFHENQSPENWVPQKTVDTAGKVSSIAATSQSCIPMSSSGGKIATSEADATFIDGNGCDDKTIFPGQKYALEDWQIKKVADRIGHENDGSVIACKTEASQIVNLYESKCPNEEHNSTNFWKWFYTTDWYATSCNGIYECPALDGSHVTERGIQAAIDVVVNGNRTLPAKIVGHDTLEFNHPGHRYNILGFYDSNNNHHSLVKSNVDQLIPRQTILTRREGSNKRFWCIIRYGNNKFGDPFTTGV